MTDSPLVSKYLPEPNHSGASTKKYIVIHDIECPPGKGWAESLGGPSYLQNPSEQHSVHYIVDANSIIQGLPESLWAWGCGTPGSAPGIQIEQAGYAAFTREMWLGTRWGFSYNTGTGKTLTFTQQDAKDMAAQMNLLARLVADIFKRKGWSASKGWMTNGDVQNVCNHGGSTPRHLTTHAQITDAVGGTVHTDPGSHYPKDVLISKVISVLGGTPIHSPIQPPKPKLSGLEEIMALDRNSAEYKRLVADIATASAAKTLGTKMNVKWKKNDPDSILTVATILSRLSLMTNSNWTRLSWLQGQLQNGVAKGQVTVGGTIASTLGVAQNAYNNAAQSVKQNAAIGAGVTKANAGIATINTTLTGLAAALKAKK